MNRWFFVLGGAAAGFLITLCGAIHETQKDGQETESSAVQDCQPDTSEKQPPGGDARRIHAMSNGLLLPVAGNARAEREYNVSCGGYRPSSGVALRKVYWLPDRSEQDVGGEVRARSATASTELLYNPHLQR